MYLPSPFPPMYRGCVQGEDIEIAQIEKKWFVNEPERVIFLLRLTEQHLKFFPHPFKILCPCLVINSKIYIAL